MQYLLVTDEQTSVNIFTAATFVYMAVVGYALSGQRTNPDSSQ